MRRNLIASATLGTTVRVELEIVACLEALCIAFLSCRITSTCVYLLFLIW
jgi:hypothetical protein